VCKKKTRKTRASTIREKKKAKKTSLPVHGEPGCTKTKREGNERRGQKTTKKGELAGKRAKGTTKGEEKGSRELGHSPLGKNTKRHPAQRNGQTAESPKEKGYLTSDIRGGKKKKKKMGGAQRLNAAD